MGTPTEVAWKDEAEKTPTRGGIPIWIRLLIAASFGFILILILGGVWLVRFANRMADPREQWASIREVIGVDEPPPPYSVRGIPRISGMKAWGVSDKPGNRHGMLYHVRGEKSAEAREAMVAPNPRHLLGTMVDPGVSVESGRIAIQGSELRCLRFRSASRNDEPAVGRGPVSIRFGPSDSGKSVEDEAGIQVQVPHSGPAILIELAPTDSETFVGFMFVVEGNSPRIEDAEVLEFLKPFHLGPDR